MKLGVLRLSPDAEGVNSIAPVFNWPSLPEGFYYDMMSNLIFIN